MSIDQPYREGLARIHDAGHGDLARDAAARLLEELARAGLRRGTVVDLGCGSGILARQLADAGYHVLGIDASEAMIALARRRAPQAELRVESFVAAALPTCVGVTAIGEVLNYQFDAGNDESARVRLLRRVRDALVPGGLFMFDVAGPERARQAAQRTFAEGPGWAVLVQTDGDAAAGVLLRTNTSFRQVGTLYERDVEVHRLILLDPSAVLASLRDLGFDAEEIPDYGGVRLPHGMTAFLCRTSVDEAARERSGVDGVA